VAASGRFRQVAALMADARSAQHRALGQLIRVRREALGISQEDLAHEAGMDRSHLGAIERGEGNPAASRSTSAGNRPTSSSAISRSRRGPASNRYLSKYSSLTAPERSRTRP
jgi:hypothetical protein